ncbi:hypothetical protein [Stigmatella ashevillensis]|uniref:hypothetical protein n=1 Tax=Stigmatella ashevillensis TaxID=2995309 RepID=UPI00280BDD12|nr:hypothetical protein [Stigmatella ashevillena]
MSAGLGLWLAVGCGQTTAAGEGQAARTSSLGVASAQARIAAAASHSLAVRPDGTVWAWGSNSSGQLGDGTTSQRTVPGAVPGLSGGVAVAAGVSHSLAVRSDGTAWASGANSNGQIGDGGPINFVSTPTLSLLY